MRNMISLRGRRWSIVGMLVSVTLVGGGLVSTPQSAHAGEPTPQKEWNPSADYVPDIPDGLFDDAVAPDAEAVQLPELTAPSEPPAADSPEGIALEALEKAVTEDAEAVAARFRPNSVDGEAPPNQLEIVPSEPEDLQVPGSADAIPEEPESADEGLTDAPDQEPAPIDEAPEEAPDAPDGAPDTVDEPSGELAPAFLGAKSLRFDEDYSDPGPACYSPGGQFGMSIWGQTQTITEVDANTAGQYSFKLSNHGTADWGSGSYLGYRLADSNGTDVPGSYPTSYLNTGSLAHNTWHDQTVSIAPLPPGTWHLSWSVFVPGTGWISAVGACTATTHLPVYNRFPSIVSQLPAVGGTVGNNFPTLVGSSFDPDGWPGTPLTTTFTICSNPAMSAGCTTSPETAGSWQVPSALSWGSTYYWRLVVSDGVGSTSGPVNSFTVVAPGVDDWRQVGNGLGVESFHGVVLPYGIFLHTARDAAVAGANTGLSIDRTYSSGASTTEGAFGRGWISVFDSQAVRTGSTANITVTYPDGRQEVFGHNADNTYSARGDLGLSNRLTVAGDGQITVTETSGETVVFDSSGRLLRVLFPDSSWEFTRSSGRINTITQQPSGRTLAVAWSSPASGCPSSPAATRAHVASITMPSDSETPSSQWAYSYDCSRLSSVTAPDGGVTRYTSTTNTFSGTTPEGRPIPGLISVGTWQPLSPFLTRSVVVSEPGSAPRTVQLYKMVGQDEAVYLDNVNSYGGVTAQVCEQRVVNPTTDECTASPVTYRFDLSNRLRSKSYQTYSAHPDPSLSRTWRYDNTGQLVSFWDENLHQIDYNYDDGMPIGSTVLRQPGVVISSLASTSFVNGEKRVVGRQLAVSGGQTTGRADMFSYDPVGRLTQRLGPVTLGAPAGESKTYVYSTSTTPAYISSGTVVAGVHPPVGLLISETGDGGTTATRYSAAGDVVSRIDPLGAVATYSYDVRGFQTTSSTTASGQTSTTTYERDEIGRVVLQTDPCVSNALTGLSTYRTIEYTYDHDGLLTRSAQHARLCFNSADSEPVRVTTYAYDSKGRLSATVNPAGGTTTFGYSTANPDQLITKTDPRGRVWQYEYSSRVNKLTAIKASSQYPVFTPVVTVATYQYDNAGQLVAESNGVGRVTKYQYTGDGIPFRATVDNVLSNGTTHTVELWRRTFDPAGRIASQVSGANYYYNYYGQEIVVDQGVGHTRTTNWSYDAEGRLQSTTEDPAGVNRVTTSIRDSVGRLVGQTITAGGRTESRTYQVDAAGNPTTVTVENGAIDLVTRLQRDQFGHVTQAVDARSGPSAVAQAVYANNMSYDTLGRVTEALNPPVLTDAPANATAFSGLVQTEVRPQTTTAYNGFGEISYTRDANGNVTQLKYDVAGNLIEKRSAAYTAPGASAPIQSIETFTYSPAGDLVSETSALGQVTQHYYDVAGNEIRTVVAMGGGSTATTLTYYTAENQPYVLVSARGASNWTTRDLLGRVISTVDSWVEDSWGGDGGLSPRWDRTYDDVGNLLSDKNPADGVNEFEYDGLGRVVTVWPAAKSSTSGQSNPARFTYDVGDRITREVGFDGVAVEHTYDLAGRETSTAQVGTDNGRHQVTLTYDGAGNLLSQTDPLGAVKRFTYDAANRLTSVEEPVTASSSIFTRVGYDSAGNIVRLRDGALNDTWTTYNSRGLKEKVIEPTTTQYPSMTDRTWEYSYGVGGVQLKTVKPGGASVTSQYSIAGLVTNQTATGPGLTANTRQFTYTNAGDLRTMTNSVGVQTYTWGSMGVLLAAQGPLGNSAATYNDDGLLDSYWVGPNDSSTAKRTWYAYDRANRLSGISATSFGGAGGVAYKYDAAGHVESRAPVSAPNGSPMGSTAITYDAFGRVSSETTKNQAGTVLQQTVSGYDNADRLTSRTSTGGVPESNAYGYDLAGRLTSWQPGASAPVPPAATNYAWDSANNRVSATTGSTVRSWTYDHRNQAQSSSVTIGGSTTTNQITRTARGTVSSIGTGAGSRTFQFNGYDELTSDTGHSYQYDALGRIATRDSAAFMYFGLQGDPAAAPIPTGGEERTSRSPDGSLEMSEMAGGSTRALLSNRHSDVTGSTVSTSTQVAGANTYDPFGTPLVGSAVLDPSRPASDRSSTFGYQGSWTDPATGLISMMSRWYDPGVGTFLSRDTAEIPYSGIASLNLHGYANADPINYYDPTGTSAINPGLPLPWGGIDLGKLGGEVGKALDGIGSALKPLAKPALEAATKLLPKVVPKLIGLAIPGLDVLMAVWLVADIALFAIALLFPTQPLNLGPFKYPDNPGAPRLPSGPSQTTTAPQVVPQTPIIDPFRLGPVMLQKIPLGGAVATVTATGSGECGLGGGTAATCASGMFGQRQCASIAASIGLCAVSEPAPGPSAGTGGNTPRDGNGFGASPALSAAQVALALLAGAIGTPRPPDLDGQDHCLPGPQGENDQPAADLCLKLGPGSKSGTSGAANTEQAAINGETTATKFGREMHASWDYGSGYSKEFTLGAGGRVDAINFETRHIFELKPNNPRAIRLGERQIEGYLAKLNEQFPGDPWTGSVVTYVR